MSVLQAIAAKTVLLCGLLWSGSAQAECARLNAIMALGNAPPIERAHLKLITPGVAPRNALLNDALRQELHTAKRAIQAVGDDENENPIIAVAEVSGGMQSAGGDQKMGAQKTQLRNAQLAILLRKEDLSRLVKLAIGIGLLVALGLLTRYGMRYVYVIRRGRSICRIPATLCCFIQDFSGHVSIIGLKGCCFVPDLPLDEETAALLSAGTHCTLIVDTGRFEARLFKDSKVDCRMLFAPAINRTTLNQLLQSSTIPNRYDFDYARKERRRG